MGNLIRLVGRLCEELLPHARAGRAAYVLGGAAPAAARVCMWLLNDIQEINALGVERMVCPCVCVSWKRHSHCLRVEIGIRPLKR